MSENVVLYPDSLSMKVIPMKLCVNGCHEFNVENLEMVFLNVWY